MKNKEGISITVLIVTVTVMIILTGVGISFFVKGNPIEITEQQVFLANLNTLQEMLDDGIEATEIDANNYVSDLDGMKEMFPDVPDKVLKKYKKEADEIKINEENLTPKEKEMYLKAIFISNKRYLQKELEKSIKKGTTSSGLSTSDLLEMRKTFPGVPDDVLKKFRIASGEIKIYIGNLTKEEQNLYKEYIDAEK